jgi:hypothetical protein
VDLFQDESKSDLEEMEERYASLDIDITCVYIVFPETYTLYSDPQNMLKAIIKEVWNTPEQNKFMAILQSLLAIALKRKKDPALW